MGRSGFEGDVPKLLPLAEVFLLWRRYSFAYNVKKGKIFYRYYVPKVPYGSLEITLCTLALPQYSYY